MTQIYDAAQLAEFAKQAKENPVIQEFIQQFEKEVFTKWKNSKNAEDRETTHQLLQMSQLFMQCLQSTMDSGLIALDALEKKSWARRITGL